LHDFVAGRVGQKPALGGPELSGGGKRGGGRAAAGAVRFAGPAFVVCEIAGDRLYFEARTVKGRIVDSGIVERAAPAGRP